jgi:phosphatidate cytidylyltransferase
MPDFLPQLPASWAPHLTPLFDASGALAHPVTRLCVAVVLGALALTPLALLLLGALGRLSPETRADAWLRYRTWLLIVPLVLGPILWCRAAAVVMLTVVALLAYREFARATGLFRAQVVSAVAAIGIVTLGVAALDHWYGLFVAVPSLAVATMAGAAVLRDQPEGYIQRVALGAVGLLLFGSAFLHLAYFTNAQHWRAVLCMLLLCTQGSDIAAYCFGKAFGSRRLFPNTSPRKTLAGHLGALVVSATLCALLAHQVFRGTAVDEWWRLALLGVLVALGAQAGDLVLGSIKRDLGLKDLARFLPGHGGVTDRVNSLLLVAPVVFHFVGYFLRYSTGGGMTEPRRILTGGW